MSIAEQDLNPTLISPLAGGAANRPVILGSKASAEKGEEGIYLGLPV